MIALVVCEAQRFAVGAAVGEEFDFVAVGADQDGGFLGGHVRGFDPPAVALPHDLRP